MAIERCVCMHIRCFNLYVILGMKLKTVMHDFTLLDTQPMKGFKIIVTYLALRKLHMTTHSWIAQLMRNTDHLTLIKGGFVGAVQDVSQPLVPQNSRCRCGAFAFATAAHS
ncbi:hypothetical protein E2C01_054608 [Portunus trituberculatus]|uniref:Uncharacterized protein n=1 Tax=Portunus trituberculatus TaxID=210409 RepID=A0A5B7GSH1_PORTR|nr:hypothetical protein [Portunus trituberculatus]